jgi:hypothetical protein
MVCAILALVPFLAGADFGVFRVPHVRPETGRWLKWIAFPALICSFALYLPVWPLVCPKVCASVSGTANPGEEASLDFVNLSSRTIKITWRSSDGKEDEYRPIVLLPGRRVDNVQTYLDHDWCVVDDTTKDFIQEVRVTRTHQQVEIHDPGSAGH